MIWDEQPKHQKANVICGAIVIRPGFVLTAAHCVARLKKADLESGRFLIKVGKQRALKVDPGEQVRRIANIILHRQYNNLTLEHDIAIVQLNQSLLFNSNTTLPIRLADSQSSDLCLEEPRGSALFTGWGRKSPLLQTGTRKLRGVILPIVSQTVCQSAFPSWPVTEGMLCAGFGAWGEGAMSWRFGRSSGDVQYQAPSVGACRGD